MSKNAKALTVQSAALSDRGLNERRPLNEDSFLEDRQRSIFAVADGVGGAEAGEVASQTAIEVLNEAFLHQTDGTDVEDLMELAIQRANSSIHQMAQEHARFSMMATTIVALHLSENVATIGHVGDSRLYRLSPDGQLYRETEDHSIVEEEVRAGRMTPEQAANHPSKNVISRALGAEDAVEVDMKTLEVQDGTEFLLCSDGITRHVSDNEIRQLLVLNEDLESVCAQLKERCFERGAEDNLTVVVVRVGKYISPEQRSDDLEPTVTPETQELYSVAPDGNQTIVGTKPDHGLIPPSRIAFPAPEAIGEQTVSPTTPRTLNIAEPDTSKPAGGTVSRPLLFVLVLALIAGAFYAGARLKERIPFLATPKAPPPQVVTAKPVEEPFLQFERARREVDRDPRAWLASDIGKELLTSGIQNPLDSPNPEFLYLYGRANLLTGNTDEAAKAFEAAITKSNANPTSTATVRKEATLGLAALTLKSPKARQNALLHYDDLTKPPASQTAP